MTWRQDLPKRAVALDGHADGVLSERVQALPLTTRRFQLLMYQLQQFIFARFKLLYRHLVYSRCTSVPPNLLLRCVQSSRVIDPFQHILLLHQASP